MPTITRRFEAKVDRSGGVHACHPWTASKNNKGYGWFRVLGKSQLAHRVAFELSSGPIPGGLFVLHHCDNPSCVNPRHLFLGDNSSNMLDSIRKGRRPRSFASKIDRSTADQIRRYARVTRESQRRVAEVYGITQGQVSRIVNRKSWP